MLGVSVLVLPLCEGDSSSSGGLIKQTWWEGRVLEMGRVKETGDKKSRVKGDGGRERIRTWLAVVHK